MSKFNLGKSKAFGNGQNIQKGNIGADFWGKGLFKYDGSLMDKQNLLKSVSNFVRILTGKNVGVRYCEEGKDESYTDGKSVTISGEIQPHCLDSTVGLALHEGSHIVKTDFKVIRNLMDKKNIDKKYHDFTKFIKGLHNWVEDRRIDHWAFNKAPGYKHYYIELYDRYFHNNEMVSQVLIEKAKELSEEKAHHYEFFIINSLHPDVKMTELKGLPEIEAIIDIDNPQRWSNTTETLEDAIKIFDVIMKHIPDEEKEKLNNTNYHPGELTDEQLDELIKAILNGQQKFLDGEPVDGDGNTIKIQVDAQTAQLLDALMKSDTKIEKVNKTENKDRMVDGDWEVVTVNHIDEETIKSGLYSIFNSYQRNGQEELIRQGLNLGTMLGNKLKIRNDERTLRTVKMKTGKIDRRNLHSAGYGSSDIFFNIKEDKYNDIGVHMTVDMSGSMGGDKWNNTLVSLVAIAKACSMIRGIRVQISLRYGGNVTGSNKRGYYDEAIVVNFYDSAFEKITKLSLLKYASPSGSTPEGLCYDALAKKIMKPLINKDTLFINFSDGAPGMGSLSTATGVKQTRDIINKFRMHGMSILSYYINESGYEGHDKENFIEMYGKDAAFIDVKSLIDLARSINAIFLKMGKQ